MNILQEFQTLLGFRPMKKATASIKKLAKAKVKFARLNTKTGTYTPVENRKDGTHKIRESAGDSAVAEPIKRGRKSFVNPETQAIVRRPKPPKFGVRQEVPRIAPDEPRESRPDIPTGATHLAYHAVGGRTIIFAPIAHLDELASMRGTIKFGKLRANEDFVSLMPGEEGDVTSWKDGVTRMATGNEPGSGNAGKQTAAPTAPRAPKPPKIAGASSTAVAGESLPAAPKRNVNAIAGVNRPAKGSKTGEVWDACDALKTELKRVPTKDEVCAKLPAHNPGTVGTQRSAWVRFHGLK